MEQCLDQAGYPSSPELAWGNWATFLYTRTQDIPLIAWRGRWARTRTLEYYLQEVSAQLLLRELSPSSKARTLELSKFCWAVLSTVFLQSSTLKAEAAENRGTL